MTVQLLPTTSVQSGYWTCCSLFRQGIKLTAINNNADTEVGIDYCINPDAETGTDAERSGVLSVYRQVLHNRKQVTKRDYDIFVQAENGI